MPIARSISMRWLAHVPCLCTPAGRQAERHGQCNEIYLISYILYNFHSESTLHECMCAVYACRTADTRSECFVSDSCGLFDGFSLCPVTSRDVTGTVDLSCLSSRGTGVLRASYGAARALLIHCSRSIRHVLEQRRDLPPSPHSYTSYYPNPACMLTCTYKRNQWQSEFRMHAGAMASVPACMRACVITE